MRPGRHALRTTLMLFASAAAVQACLADDAPAAAAATPSQPLPSYYRLNVDDTPQGASKPAPPALLLVANQDRPFTAHVGDNVFASYKVSGGTPPYKVTYGDEGPGMTVSAVLDSPFFGNGVVDFGNPTMVGDYPPYLVHVTDSSSPPQTADLYTRDMTVLPAAPPMTITLTQDFPSSALLGGKATAYFNVQGGDPTQYVFLTDPDIINSPPGCEVQRVNDGDLNDLLMTCPVTDDIPSVTLYAIDSSQVDESGYYTTYASLTLSAVSAQKPDPLVGFDLLQNSTTMQVGYQSNAAKVFAIGGVPPFTMQIVSGAANAYLSYDKDFTQNAGGDVSFYVTAKQNPQTVVRITDSVGSTYDWHTQAYRGVNGSAAPYLRWSQFAGTNPNVRLGDGQKTAYLTWSGGTRPYKVTMTPLPFGVTYGSPYFTSNVAGVNQYDQFFYNANTSGLTAGPIASFSVTVTDSSKPVQSATYATNAMNFVGTGTAPDAFAVTATSSIPSEFAAYSKVTATYAISGGTQPYTLVPSDPMPEGFSEPTLSGSTVTVTGQPTVPGYAGPFQFGVTDARGRQAGFVGNVYKVDAPSPLTVAAKQDFPSSMALGDPLSATFEVTGGATPYTLTYAKVPAGLSVQTDGNAPGDGSDSYTVYGTPTKAGNNAGMELTIVDAVGTAKVVDTSGFTTVKYGDATHVTVVPNAGLPSTVPSLNSAYGRYEVFGGVKPYTVTWSGLPSWLVPSPETSDAYNNYVWDLGGTASFGTYSGMTMNVRDLQGHTGSFTLPTLTVR